MLKKLINECKLKLQITTTGPLLVKSGYATPHGPDMTPVLTYRNNQEQVFIPGSSLKGVFRSHIEKVIRTLKKEAPSVCLLYEKLSFKNVNGHLIHPKYEEVFCGNKFELRRGMRFEDDQRQEWTFMSPDLNDNNSANAIVYRDSCPACRLFGSTFFIGRLAISDAYLMGEPTVEEYTELRDGVAIDRFTGGSAHGALFEMKVIRAGVAFQTEIYLRNFEIWQLGALMLILQDLEDKLIRVGSGRSRGLGEVQGSTTQINIQYIKPSIEQKSATEVWGLGKFSDSDGNYGTFPDDLLSLTIAPATSNSGIRRIEQFSGQSLADLREKAMSHFVQRMQNWPYPTAMQFDPQQFQRETGS